MKHPRLVNAAIAVLGTFMLAACGVAYATDNTPNTNDVSYWCDAGKKYEPVATPFVIPAPPTGWVWTLLVLKAGSGDGENQIWENPVVGQSYSRDDGKNISHVILCKEPAGTTTSSSSTTSSTTTTSTTTSTTVPPCPDCTPNTVVTIPPPPGDGTTTTTSTLPGQTTTTVPGQTTTTTVPGATTTTVPGATTTSSPGLPVTG